MVNSGENSGTGSIADGLEAKPCSDGSDLKLAAEDLSEQFKNVNVGLEEDCETVMSVCDSNGGLESKEDGEYGWSESESEKREVFVYPLRPGAEDCSFYMRTGTCKYGSTCKFNHPLPDTTLIARDNVRGKDEDADKLRPNDCKYYFRTGGCKYGETCRFNHTKPKSFQSSPPDLNFLGLPVRPGEIECPYYMRTGSCKYGSDCKFNHPDPTSIGGTDSPSFLGNNGANKGGSVGSFSPKSTFQASSTPRHANGTTPLIPTMLSQSHVVPDWNGYQAASVSPSERNVYSPSSTTYLMNNSSAETSIFSQYQHQMPAEEFPERPDQPECSYYLKTGDCKFKFTCKFHHPKNRLPKQPPYALNDKGLPLRPDQNICTHYSRYGICKFGPACRFDHSVQQMYSAGSSQAIVEVSEVGGNGNDSDGWN